MSWSMRQMRPFGGYRECQDRLMMSDMEVPKEFLFHVEMFDLANLFELVTMGKLFLIDLWSECRSNPH